MKKTIFTMAAIAFFAVTASTSFAQNTDKKSDKAREDLTEAKQDLKVAKQDLKEAQQDSVADYQTFKKDSEARFLKNEKSLADWKLKVTNSDVSNRAEYERNLATLNQKNADLKKRFVEFKQDGKTKWSSFKSEFNNDMDDFGKELKDFTIDIK